MSFLTWSDASQVILGTDQDNNGMYTRLTTHWTFWLTNNGSPHLTRLADTGRTRSPMICIERRITHFGLLKGLWSPIES